ncbi:tRNA U55 pseudouridine synthase TruB [Pseudomonas syringae pv. actinidiae]|uniref:tRNA U55 pseudouridine synthase TruB n=1 Tax=Pseudomonas syringae pv. actinidiae TaxID=103796 RepID=A0A2V0QAF8_PSESF|nr:tRNA U55 pseudouridine synthase TruB [Pseudomonas syringae pv. actinidiae]
MDARVLGANVPAVSSAMGGRGDLNDGPSAVSSFDCGGRKPRRPNSPIRRNVSKSGLEDLGLEAHPFKLSAPIYPPETA